MGTLASAKIIPMIDEHTDPEPASVEAKVSVAQGPDTPARVAAEFTVPEPEPIPAVSLSKVFLDLLGYVTRERIITAALACLSIGALFLFWYLGTKYKFEFY